MRHLCERQMLSFQTVFGMDRLLYKFLFVLDII